MRPHAAACRVEKFVVEKVIVVGCRIPAARVLRIHCLLDPVAERIILIPEIGRRSPDAHGLGPAPMPMMLIVGDRLKGSQ